MTLRMTLWTMLPLFLAVGLLACQPKTDPGPAKAKSVPAAKEGDKAAAPAAATAEEGKHCDHDKGEAKDEAKPADGEKKHVESGCGGEGGKLENPEPQVRKDDSGAEVAHYGDAFSLDTEVAVTELLANPQAYKGKMIRLKGDISAMCHHKRGWFAIAAEDKSGRSIRVVTQPVFLVPHGAIGKTAVAEGTVDLIEVAPKFAAHLKEGHNLGDKPEAGKPIIHVVVRARGAEFM